VQYQSLSTYASNNTGYASANLKLLSMEYTLFRDLKFDFCGGWVTPSEGNGNGCPEDGSYDLSLQYDLPWDDQDITTWLATGWQGQTDLEVYSNATDSDPEGVLLAQCKLQWKTYVTQSSEEGWQTLPSAAQSSIIVLVIMVAMCLVCTYLTFWCRRRRNREVHITLGKEPKLTTGEATGDFKRLDDVEVARKIEDDPAKKTMDATATKEPDWE
jgi:hypothetical protein